MRAILALAIALNGPWGSVSTPYQTGAVGLRQIVVRSSSRAAEIRAQVLAGVPFELLARRESVDPSSGAGGYMGRMVVANLRPEFQDALADLAPGEVSSVIALGGEYLLLQIVSEAEEDWIARNAAGLDAFTAARHAEAEEHLRAALDLAEGFGPEDYRLARSLIDLADLYRSQGRHAEAAALYRRAIPIWEATFGPDDPGLGRHLNSLGLSASALENFTEAEGLYLRALGILEGLDPDHPEVAITLNNLAEIYRLDGRYAEAEPLFRRSLSILEAAAGPDHPAVQTSRNNLIEFHQSLINELLERLSTLLSFAAFPDERYDAALAAYEELAALAPLDRDSYLSMTDVLVAAGLHDQAESALLAGIEAFPESRELRYHLAEEYVTTGRIEDGLEVFQEASRMAGEPGIDPVLDGQQRAFIQRRIGDIQWDLGAAEAAEAAYRTALEIDPSSVDARVASGAMYRGLNQLDTARDHYAAAAELDPDSYEARMGLGEVYLALADYAAAAATATEALEIDPDALRPRFVRGTAWIRDGRREEGRAELELHGRLEAEAQAAEHRSREVDAIQRSAMTTLLEGAPEAAIEEFRAGIASYPDESRLHFDLAMAQMKMGRHGEAIETLNGMIENGISDDLLIHKHLAEAYEALGESEASARHRSIYLEKRNSELMTNVQ